MDKMRAEWEAWLATNIELKEAGFQDGWDDPAIRKLHASLLVWGECIADLRIEQSSEIRFEARSDAERQVRLANMS